jgi:CheY-like chemotaxis protein
MTEPTESILVVDDSPSKRYVLGRWLRRGGYAITEATTGAEALERMEDTDIDLVILDVRLPDMSGFTVSERIKENPAHASTPVIHVSAAAVEMEDRKQGLARGADAYLVDPIDPEELLATVHAILRYYRGRQQAERYAARLAVLTRLTLKLGTARNLAQLLRDAVAGAAVIYQGPVVVYVQDPDGPWMGATVAGPGGQPAVRSAAPPDGVFPPPGGLDDVRPERIDLVPWPKDQTVRVVSVGTRPDRSPVHIAVSTGAADVGSPLLTLLGQAVASAVETMRAYTVEHQLALTLQRSLLPRALPQVDGVEMAVRYVPASENAEIGGDFYELSCLDGEVIVAVGDVGGHSLHAATVMAEVRHATRAYLAEGHSPGQVIHQLSTLMSRMIPNEIVTMCLLTLDPGSGRIRLANAGHPAPLIIEAGAARSVGGRVPLLGIASTGPSEIELELARGATMVLYTDGLVERRGENIDTGIARLASAAARVEADLDTYCDRLLEQVGPAEPFDDIAIVALRRA